MGNLTFRTATRNSNVVLAGAPRLRIAALGALLCGVVALAAHAFWERDTPVTIASVRARAARNAPPGPVRFRGVTTLIDYTEGVLYLQDSTGGIQVECPKPCTPQDPHLQRGLLAEVTGMMRGAYRMVHTDGSQFDIEIAPFALRARYTVH